tara:strand:+ start:16603 stop:16776 length:174 start_codon:yes stop_codon:yes gene_type:complete
MIRTKRIGGIRFFWIGPMVISICIRKKPNPKLEKIKGLKSRIKTAQRDLKRGNLQWT